MHDLKTLDDFTRKTTLYEYAKSPVDGATSLPSL